jgi:hypothetical protein
MSGARAKQRVGRAVELSTADRQEIALLRASGLSGSEISRRTGRTRRTVQRALDAPDMERLRQQALDILWRAAGQFADDFKIASRAGAERGRYEAARAALEALKIIEPPKAESLTGVIVHVGCALPGTENWRPDQDDAKPVTLEVTPTTTSNDDER